jgi:hypothetical protein
MNDELPLPLTTPVTEIVIDALAELDDRHGLDRDEAYLLARLKRGETLELQCGWRAPSGNVCIKPAGHTGNHATRKP